MISLLLGNGAERDNRIIAEYQPMFEDKEAFLAFCESLRDSGDRIVYHEDGTATARID